MIGRMLGRRGGPPRKAAKSGPAARAFLHLARDGAVAEESGPSPARRAAGLFLALMVLAAMPLYWVSAASGHGGDQPAAVKSGSSGPGSGEEDDEGDDDTHDDDGPSATGTATSHRGDGTRGTTGGTGNTFTEAPSATGTATSHRGDGTRGTTNNTGVSLAG
jgi:hypothetical protein